MRQATRATPPHILGQCRHDGQLSKWPTARAAVRKHCLLTSAASRHRFEARRQADGRCASLQKLHTRRAGHDANSAARRRCRIDDECSFSAARAARIDDAAGAPPRYGSSRRRRIENAERHARQIRYEASVRAYCGRFVDGSAAMVPRRYHSASATITIESTDARAGRHSRQDACRSLRQAAAPRLSLKAERNVTMSLGSLSRAMPARDAALGLLWLIVATRRRRRAALAGASCHQPPERRDFAAAGSSALEAALGRRC